MLNIPSTVEDINYRYKMHKLQTKVESKGNGIKTNVVNLNEIAKDLRTDANYILKYFGLEKGSLTTFKDAGGKNNTCFIINGDFSNEELLKLLDKYIEKYVCCPKCKLPEMHMLVMGEKIVGKCDSCPFNGELQIKHKQLTAYILKNPPTAKNMATGKKEKSKVEVNQQFGKYKIDKKKPKEEEKEEESAVKLFTSEGMDFGSEQLKELILYVQKFVDKRKDEDFDIKSAEIVAELRPLHLKKSIIAYILFHTFFNVNIANQLDDRIKLYKNLMRKLGITNIELETMLNIQYMFLEENNNDISKFASTIMCKLYENELFSEDFIRKWSEDKLDDVEKNWLYHPERNQKFKAMTADFIEWVADAGEEEEEEKE